MFSVFEPFSYEFMQRALIACLLIGFTNGFLSAFIVLRRLALLADALSHSLLPGLAVGAILFGLAPAGLFIGALVAAGLVGLGGQLIARSSRLKDETAIASLYTIAFALGILLIKYARVPVDLHHFLFGNILGLSNMDLWLSYAISFVTIVTLLAFQREYLLVMFDPTLAASQGIRVPMLTYLLMGLTVLAMISSLQAIGVVLSLGLLIIPGAAVYLLTDSFAVMAWGGGVLGAVGSIIGLLISYWIDVPSGPAIVFVLGIGLFLALLFGTRYGVLARLHQHAHLHEESLKRWAPTAEQPIEEKK
jgi:ABC-type Mn2+/Zn2+ transport system permease subunit